MSLDGEVPDGRFYIVLLYISYLWTAILVIFGQRLSLDSEAPDGRFYIVLLYIRIFIMSSQYISSHISSPISGRLRSGFVPGTLRTGSKATIYLKSHIFTKCLVAQKPLYIRTFEMCC